MTALIHDFQTFDDGAERPERRKLFLDWETKCDLDLKVVGLDRYSSHPSCEIILAAWAVEDGEVEQYDRYRDGPDLPRRLVKLLEDPDIEVHAFNAQFERVVLTRTKGIVVPIDRWRCTMALAYMFSFTGTLDRVGSQVGIPQDKAKMAEGKALIRRFCAPQRVTKRQPFRWCDDVTHGDEWELFKLYNRRDVEAEREIDRKLDRQERFPIREREWQLYALDQIINDRGLPIDVTFCRNAYEMATRRKKELVAEMSAATGLANGNSGAQLIPWLKARGYPFDDLQKDTVKKTLAADKARRDGDKVPEGETLPVLTDECRRVLQLRLKANRTSHSKYKALLDAVGDDGRMRFVFQFAGASRTLRFAGRRFQPQNLTSIKDIEDESVLEYLTDTIRAGDYDGLALLRDEPMDALAGLVRSSVRAPSGKKFVVCDLSSIESVVIGYVTNCRRLLEVFRSGKDAYKDFATELYRVVYEEVTKAQRKQAKPATLGAGYRLGGGEIRDGKKTGLWGYAENMGVEMSRKEAHKNVATFRRVYPEIPNAWYEIERCIIRTIQDKVTTRYGSLKFAYRAPFLMCVLPSGHVIYYHKPRVEKKPFTYTDKDGVERKTVKDAISYMGKQQNGSNWIRVYSHGGKFIENIVQAFARDVLQECMLRLHNFGFNLMLHVHDECVAEERSGDNRLTHEVMRDIMCESIRWAPDLPLGAAGFETKIYRKD